MLRAGFDNKYIEAALDISRKEQDLRNRERRAGAMIKIKANVNA